MTVNAVIIISGMILGIWLWIGIDICYDFEKKRIFEALKIKEVEEATEKPSTDMMTWYTKPPEEPQIGDVYIDQNNMLSMFNGKRWETVYPDPGYMEAGKIHPTNCENCGAPLTGHVCEYCGSVYE